MKNKYLIYGLGYRSFDITQTEKIRVSNTFPSKMDLSQPYQFLNFTLKSPGNIQQDMDCFELLGLNSTQRLFVN